MEKLIYFSLNENTIKAFHNYVKIKRYEYQFSFSLVALDEYSYSHVSDLSNYLEQQKSLSHLKVIIDYVSLTCPNEKETIKEAQESIRRLILKYPEVLFLFDETGCDSNEYNFSFTDFLLPGYKELVDNYLFKEYHQFDANKEDRISGDPFPFFKRSRNNLFDGSNLRYLVKRYLYGDLKVGKYNFGLIQNYRAKNLALCVEEEESQSRFNCFSLYSNGCRVLPVLSAEELKHFNSIHETLNPTIIIRDYDLQFEDIFQSPKSSEFNQIDYVRGYKYLEEYKKWINLTDNSEYWNNFVEGQYPILFVTKGLDNLFVDLSNPQAKIEQNYIEGDNLYVNGLYKPVSGIYMSFQEVDKIKDIASKVITCYNSSYLYQREYAYNVFYNKFLQINAYQQNLLKEKEKLLADNNIAEKEERLSKFDKFIEIAKKHKKAIIDKYIDIIKTLEDNPSSQSNSISKDYFWSNQIYTIKTSRADHDHCVPLNVYYMVKEMVDRAKVYYEEKRYIRAAIVSWDAIEVMNGFHETLLLDAYRIYALSENAIAINILGGKEEELTADTRFRVRKIQEDVKRILYRGHKKKYREKFARNTLNQIFSECRAFCKQKKHIESEEVFISAIGRLNHSDSLYSLCQELWKKIMEKRYEIEYRYQLNKINTSFVISK